jgi:hypothetical protein
MRQIMRAGEIPPTADVAPEPLSSDVMRAFDTPDEFTCPVGRCAITGRDLYDYSRCAGSPEIVGRVHAKAPLSCALTEWRLQGDLYRLPTAEDTPPQ